MTKTLTFSEFAKKIVSLPHKHHQRIIAIDGGGGAGKTTFADCLQKEIPGSQIVRIDDFYRPEPLRKPVTDLNDLNPNFDWDRIHELVLERVKNNRTVSYQPYDHNKGILSDKVISVPQEAMIIVEGVWSMQNSFMDYYDYSIWLEAPADIRLERGVSRDGEELRHVWEEEWIPIDESYQKNQAPQDRANCVIDSVKSDFQNNSIVLRKL